MSLLTFHVKVLFSSPSILASIQEAFVIVGHHFGMWYIKGITVNNKPLKKYKEVREKHDVEIQPISIEELNQIGDEHCFPQELLQDP